VDQQVISRMSVPAPIMETYNSCEPPPALNELNAFREDGKISLKYFTDPDYFFRLWFEEMKEQTEREHQKKKKKKVFFHIMSCIYLPVIVVYICIYY
jgi:hypothetical protein